MADSFSKKEREKKRRKRKQDKLERKEQKKSQGITGPEFMYLDENGNLTSTPPDPNKKKKEIKAEEILLGPPTVEKGEGSKFLRSGQVKFFNEEKGYGFIVDLASKDSFFIHADNLIDQIKDNDAVTFEIGKGNRGPVAIEVRLVNT